MSVAGILNKIKNIKHPHEVYLVGGIVRDILLRRDTKDIDLVCRQARTLAQKFAKTTGSTLFTLDEENKIYRVVIKLRTPNGQPPTIYDCDFAELRGRNIEQDLALRDFTIDAMAVKLVGGSRLAVSGKSVIDPYNGQEDLKKRIIRMVGNNIFQDDSLRLMRAFRLAGSLEFRIEPVTLKLIAKQSKLIKKSAPERVREELVKILSCPDSATTLDQMDKCGLLPVLVPEFQNLKTTAQDFYGRDGVWHHTLSGLRYLEEILPALGKYLPKHALKISGHLGETITGEVTRATILKLAYLMHDLGKPSTHTREGKRSRFYGHELAGVKLAEKVQTRLHFSNKEIQAVRNVIANHMRPGNLSALAQVTDKAIYRYFRDLKSEGLDTLVLSLADAYTTEATVIKRNKQNIYPVDSAKHLKAVREIINRYYTRPQQITPLNLLNGNEIISRFKLAPGPLIGKLINELKEAQAQKLVKTKPQAYSYLKNIIDKDPNLQ